MYRNVHGILVPSLCYQSQFMERKDIANIMGFYDVDIYSDEKGNIQYITHNIQMIAFIFTSKSNNNSISYK